jgi:hypothetical protein
MDSLNKQSRAKIKESVAYHKSEIKELKMECRRSLSVYKMAVEEMRKAYIKFDRATKTVLSKPCEKNEILLLGAEKNLAKSVTHTKDVAKDLNSILLNIEKNYNAISTLFLDSNRKAAAAYAVKKNVFVERVVMAIDEVEQLVMDMTIPAVDSLSMNVDTTANFAPESRVRVEGNWAAHTLNQDLTKHKYSVKYDMPMYKNVVRDLERAAIALAKLNRKQKRSSSKNKSATLEVAKAKYLEAVGMHNCFAMSINSSIDNAFNCYDELRKTLSPKGRRVLARIASEQDKYSLKLQRKIDKLRAPIVRLGLKTIGAHPTK